MEEESKIYYECHVTIEPVFDEKLEKLKELCKEYGFSVADLLFKKRKEDSPTRSEYDSFCTARDINIHRIRARLLALLLDLKDSGYQVWRYKIEDTIIDSKHDDSFFMIQK